MSDRHSSSDVVARGRIRVDARKALDKLRDHMLVDAHLWACEIARAAVALGATRLDVGWDAHDLILDFDGRTLAPEQITHARDHVLTPLDGEDGAALRALGIGIGAALSLDPSYVDVLSGGKRIRFERDYMSEEHAPPTPEPIRNFDVETTRVHVRKKLGLGSLSRSISGETPAEIPLLISAFEAPHCQLRIRGEMPARPEAPVLSVDLDVPGTTRALLEILRRPAEPRTDFLHYGVRLASASVRGCWGLAVREGALLPLRILVDAPDLPTNASRSQVRSDAELVQRVLQRTTPAFAVAVAALRGEKSALTAKIGHVVTVHAERAVLTDVLGAVAAEAARAIRAGATVEPEGHALLEDKVAFDALGDPIALGSLRGGTKEHPLRVYDGERPLPESLAPWFTGTLWRRGLSSERAIEGMHIGSIQDLVEPALAAQSRRARALEHPASKPVVATAKAEWKESFTVTEGPYAGLEGEVALRKKGLATARVFVDERAIETVTLPGVSLPIDLALAWRDRLVASFGYDGVERNDDLSRALHYGLRVAATAIGAHAVEPVLLRTALVAWADATRGLGDARLEPGAMNRLATQPAFRTNDGKLVPFVAIYGYAKRTGAICHASVKTAAADGRIVIASDDVPALRPLFAADAVEFIAYDAALTADPDRSEQQPSLAVEVNRGGMTGFITPSPSPAGRLRVYHAGVCGHRQNYDGRNGPVEVVLVDRSAVPGKHGTFLHFAEVPELAAEEDALVEVVTQACESDAIALESVNLYLTAARAKILARDGNTKLAVRIAALPQRREQQRLARLKALVTARAPIDVAARTGGKLRGTVVVPQKGAVSVVLAPLGPATILFAGHPLGTQMLGRLDVEAFVDVLDEGYVEEWDRLSDQGKLWAEGAIVEAAIVLLDKLVSQSGFTESALALQLMLFLLSESPARVGMIFQKVPWPTVQGGTHALGDVPAVNVGINRFEPWRAGHDVSPYDAPALHFPMTAIGEMRRKLFAAAGVALTDVTDATTRLQALRARGSQGAAPALPGKAAEPRLRRSLAELGGTILEGEIELVDGTVSDIARVRSGVREPIAIDIGCPIRAVFRSEASDAPTIGRELIDAAKRLLEELTPKLESLPNFVRKRVRALVLARMAQTGRMTDADANLPIFEATNGRFYRLAFLQGNAPFTSDPPPYPPVDDLVLCLERGEAQALAKVFELRDDTNALRARARGLAARAAPPLTEIRVREREQCMFFVEVNEEGVRGEIGLLQPDHAASRRIELYTTMRPLTYMPDPEGWPILAALNDDSVEADDAFAGLVDAKKETTRLHRLLRRVVGASVGGLLRAPPDALGVVRLPVPLLLRSVRTKRTAAAMGVFWLPKEWPERPTIHVQGVGVVAPERVPLLDVGPESRVVPVQGKLWVTAPAAELSSAIADVMAWVSVRLAAHARHARDPQTKDRYRWDLALLGVLDEPGTDVQKELEHDRPDPDLMHVVARRAPHLIDKQTGDAPTLPTHVQHAELAGESAEAEAPGERLAAIHEPAPAESFFTGLLRRVTELVAPTEVLTESPLTTALADALVGMALTGHPVAAVRATKRGRPVTYKKATRTVLVNAEHEIVRALAKKPTGILHLVLAALSEINRELVEVTDQEEAAKILDLLRANG